MVETLAGGEVVDQRRSAGRIRRPVGLPGGRAVVGALLVTAAAVTVVAAHLSAVAEPTTVYLVAGTTIEPGTRLDDRAALVGMLTSAAVTLPPELAERAIPVEELDGLLGGVVVAPLGYGDLVLRSAIVGDGSLPAAQSLSFRLPASDAVAGTLVAGERIDVLATFGSGERSFTAYVVSGVPLLRVEALDGGAIGPGSELTLTVAVGALEDVQALAHAIATGTLLVTRSTAITERDRDSVPTAHLGAAPGSPLGLPGADPPAAATGRDGP
jgi:hypothetical protein